MKTDLFGTLNNQLSVSVSRVTIFRFVRDQKKDKLGIELHMDSQDSKDRAKELAEHDHRRDAESSIPESSSKKFGLGKKCLIVFAAAVVASAIVIQLEGQAEANSLMYLAHLLCGATAFFLMAMVNCSVRSWKHRRDHRCRPCWGLGLF